MFVIEIVLWRGFSISLGARIAEARKKCGLTQTELADKVNVNQAVVSYWEKNKSIPTLSNMIALSKALDISLDWAVFGHTHKTGDSKTTGDISNQIHDLQEKDREAVEQIIDSLLLAKAGLVMRGTKEVGGIQVKLLEDQRVPVKKPPKLS